MWESVWGEFGEVGREVWGKVRGDVGCEEVCESAWDECGEVRERYGGVGEGKERCGVA